jgi:Family of unknown function (DUF6157)
VSHSTNYTDTFISVAPDYRLGIAVIPEKPGSVAKRQYDLLIAAPYTMTSDDLLFSVYAQRQAIPIAQQSEARAQFFAKPQACLRASPLAKTHGWGLHHDGEGRVALCARESPDYARFLSGKAGKIVAAMRSKRA